MAASSECIFGNDPMTSRADPEPHDAAAIAAEVLGASAETAVRFPTGLRHFVYDVKLVDGRHVVVRISRRDDVEAARGAICWSSLLRPKGVPLPELLHADLSMTRYAFPVIVLERLPGDDLGIVYGRLSRLALRAVAERLAAIQAIVTALPSGRGYGYATSYDEEFPHASWGEAVAASITRGRSRIRAAGVVNEDVVDAVEAAAGRFAGYFARIEPVPFLHDITTKNVIVHEGRLSGIVDVDDLCFGDPLLLLGLIRMALLAQGLDPFYVEQWREIMRPDAEQTAAIDLYTALYCIDFMSELGQRFNQAAPVTADAAYLARLRIIMAQLLGRIV
jgi:aminoglycoside phosphotransferase (APT) family kinase protein